ncbi:MAG: hypothetical protein WAM63_21395 [Rhodomicrobium sp.]
MSHRTMTAIAASLLCAAPISLHWSPTQAPQLSVDGAQARIGRPLTPFSVAGVNRRINRRAYYGGYGGYYGGHYRPYYGYAAGIGAAAIGAAAIGAAAIGTGAAYNNYYAYSPYNNSYGLYNNAGYGNGYYDDHGRYWNSYYNQDYWNAFQ